MADNAGAFRILDDKIARLRVLVTLPDEAVPVVAKAIGAELDRQFAAGTDPYGKPWAPRKADGEKPLQRVAKDVKVGIVGRTVIARITARHVVLHHFGAAKGKAKRQVLPSGKEIPRGMETAIRSAIAGKFTEIMEGER